MALMRASAEAGKATTSSILLLRRRSRRGCGSADQTSTHRASLGVNGDSDLQVSAAADIGALVLRAQGSCLRSYDEDSPR